MSAFETQPRHVRFVPQAESCTAAKPSLFHDLIWSRAAAVVFCPLSANQRLAWLVAATVAVCSVHSPGPGLARMVAAMAASCSEHFPGLELAWFVPGTAAFRFERSLGHSVARPSSGNTSCKLSIVSCAASPGTSRHRFPFAAQHKAFAHPARTMLGGRLLSLKVSCRLCQLDSISMSLSLPLVRPPLVRPSCFSRDVRRH
jgi:hypothetical protein